VTLSSPPAYRYWEVDAARGIAIVLMVIYHFTWDLNHFGLYSGNMLATPWQTFARSIATMFIFVMGVSLTLSYNRLKRKISRKRLLQKNLLRGAKIFGWGLLITLGTYFFIGDGFVVFGILHLLGLSIILASPFLFMPRRVSLIAAVVVIGLGIYAEGLVSPSPWLIGLGVKQAGRYMVDYYPLLPWFGVALLGLFFGFTLYPEGKPAFHLPDLANTPPIRGLTFLGKHSLLIYLIHQPILFAGFILAQFLSVF